MKTNTGVFQQCWSRFIKRSRPVSEIAGRLGAIAVCHPVLFVIYPFPVILKIGIAGINKRARQLPGPLII